MRILHIGPFAFGTASGHYNAVWSLARAQARAGHDVGLLALNRALGADVRCFDREGVVVFPYRHRRKSGFLGDRGGQIASVLRDFTPDIAHLYYVREPRLIPVVTAIRRLRVPFVFSLHGGLNPVEMRRKRLRKEAYWRLIDARVQRQAAGFHFISRREHDYYIVRAPLSNRLACVVPNVVSVSDDIQWESDLNWPLRAVYLGRFDVWTKGLDLAARFVGELNRVGLPAELHCYGTSRSRDADVVARLSGEAPAGQVQLHGLLQGREKWAALAGASLYLQYSRFELFGLSAMEAMAVGVPTLLSEDCDIAAEADAASAGVVLPMDPAVAARQVLPLLRDRTALGRISAAGRSWARARFSEHAVVHALDDFYARARRVQR